MIIQDRRGQYLQSGRSWYTRDVAKVTKITVHHSAMPKNNYTDDELLNAIKTVHTNQGWAGLSYHLVYNPKTRNVFWINDYSWVTWHDAVNWDSIGVLINGYYHPPTNDGVTKEILIDMKDILDHLCTEHPEFPAAQQDVYGHRERSSTACLPLDNTEVLTDCGFISLRDVKEDTQIAQFDQNTQEIVFGKPKKIIDPYYSEVIVNEYIEQTANHQTLRYTSKKNLIKENWGDVTRIRDAMIPTSGEYISDGLNLTDDEIRYLVAVQADGYYARDNRVERVKNGKKYNSKPYEIGVEFHLKKDRKIDRLIDILESIGADYSIRKNNTLVKVKHGQNYDKNWCEQYLNNKHFTEIFFQFDKHQADIFLNELRYWDGRSTVDYISYSSVDKQNIDVVQGVAALHGYRSKSKESNRVYEVSVVNKNFQTIPQSYSRRETMVGCVEVEKSNIVVRQNGFVFVTGNCPGDILIPYVQEYRVKLGKVDWSTGTTPNQQVETITIPKTTYEHLVGGATVRKELAYYLELPDPDNTPLESFKSVIAGYKSEVTTIRNERDEIQRKLHVAEQEILNLRDKIANTSDDCQKLLDLKTVEIDTLKQNAANVDKMVRQYMGTIDDLRGRVRELERDGGLKDIEITKLKTKIEQLSKGVETVGCFAKLFRVFYETVRRIAFRK